MKRVFLFVFVFMFSVTSVFGATSTGSNTSASQSKKILVYLKPDIKVELNQEEQIFYDTNNRVVYPIIYNGMTYLPVRAMSDLMNEPIEWDGGSKTIYIGKTLTNPNKNLTQVNSTFSVSGHRDEPAQKAEIVSAYLKPDILIMYDFVMQSFSDDYGNRTYPIIYGGSTYLPLRAIAGLTGFGVDWNGTTKTVELVKTDEEAEPEKDPADEQPSEAVRIISKYFEREEILYYEATAKTTNLKQAATLSEKQTIASIISENYLSAQKMTLEIKAIDTSSFDQSELNAYNKLEAFAESTEYYILLLENIAYLAAAGEDYSMLAETFMYFALDSQNKMEDARKAIDALAE